MQMEILVGAIKTDTKFYNYLMAKEPSDNPIFHALYMRATAPGCDSKQRSLRG